MSSPAADSTSFARLFIGLWPDDALRDALWAHSEHWRWTPNARRVPPSKLHMTLHFLGSVPRDRLPELVHGLSVPVDRFLLRLEHGEVWPNQIAVLMPRDVAPAMRSLHQRLHIALGQLQQPSEREELMPHVTLARKAKGARPPLLARAIDWRVDGYALIESIPGQGYRPLYHYR